MYVHVWAFPYLSTYMYIVLETHTCKVMCEV